MKNLKKILLCLVAVLSFSFLMPTLPASAASTSEEVTRIADKISAREEEIFAYESDDLAVHAARFRDYSALLRQSADELNNLKANNAHQAKIAAITAAMSRVATVGDALATALENDDESAYAVAYSDLEAATTDLESAGEAYDKYLKDNPLESGDTTYAIWYIVLIASLACLAIALIVFFVCKNQHGTVHKGEFDKNGKSKETTLKNLRKSILVAAVIFVIGAAIPAVQYYIAIHSVQSGEEFTYYIFWYPLAVGAFMFITALPNYFFQLSKLKKSGELKNADDATAMALAKINKIHQDK
jgi:hypothetical protein